MGFCTKANLVLSLLLVLVSAALASATSVAVIQNPNFNCTPSLLTVQGNKNPDSWDGASTPAEEPLQAHCRSQCITDCRRAKEHKLLLRGAPA
jgi:hypothetical protein